MPAPDLYEALGGQLTSLNDQLAGFQQELAGMSGQVPAPSVVPPNVSSPMGQVGSVLADLFAPVAGVKNPVTERQEAYRAQQLEGVKERRSILQQRLGVTKEQGDLVKAQTDLEKHRQEQEDAPLKFVPGLLSIKTPAATLMAGQLIGDSLTRRGIQVPEGFVQGLLSKEYSFDDLQKIALGKAYGHSPEVLRGAFPHMPDDAFRAAYDLPIDDNLMKSIDPHWKTKVELEKEALDLKIKTRKELEDVLKAQRLAVLPGGGATNSDLIFIDGAAMDRNGGKHFWELDQAARDRAIADWKEWKTAKDDPAAKVGLAGLLNQARQNTNRHKVDQGKGRWYDPVTDTYRVDIDGVELASGRFKSIGEKNWANVEFMRRATVMADKLRNVIPKVLSDTPVDNIRRLLANETNKYTGADPNLSEFFRLVYMIPMEEVRAVGGTTAVRQGLYQVLQKHASVKPYDTQRTAKQVVDSLKVDFYNLQATIHDMPQLLPGQRIGPGRFLYYPIDPVTRAPIFKDAAGQDLGKISKPWPAGKPTPKDVYIMETVD